MKKKHNIKALILFLILSIGVGALAGFITKDSAQIYAQYNKPIFSPSDMVLGIVWSILYILMGISAYLIYNTPTSSQEENKVKYNALFIFFLQLVVNFFWPIIYFNLNQVLFAFIWIILLLILVIYMVKLFFTINKPAALLQIPYILWLLFASYLNLGIYILNS